MHTSESTCLKQLVKKGVRVSNPQTIAIDKNVELNRISGEGVTIHTGSKISGNSTLICHGVTLGQEGPVTIENCQIGPGVQLKGGYYKDAVFLKNSSMGSGAHVREGTVLEEEASGAHTVGLKQTILFPYVTLGSLINFCDCLMAGGTSRKNHSEVGSSYIHFNFTPNQDKATASLIGDVPHGVMLNQPPIFLGGQGGLVGPSRLAFGTVIAAGSIYRKDELRPGRLLAAGGGRGISVPYTHGMYQSVRRIVVNNILYIANLMALKCWYRHVRGEFISEDFPQPLYDGLLSKVDMAVTERIKRFKLFAEKMPDSIRIYKEAVQENASASLLAQKSELSDHWSLFEEKLIDLETESGDEKLRHQFLETLAKGIQAYGKGYIPVIKGLSDSDKSLGTIWMKGIVDKIYSQSISEFPSIDK